MSFLGDLGIYGLILYEAQSSPITSVQCDKTAHTYTQLRSHHRKPAVERFHHPQRVSCAT